MSMQVTAMKLISDTFGEGDTLPVNYTCDGAGISPPLAWGEQPAGTAGFVLILDDPDAPDGTFTHWLVFNIPSEKHAIPENAWLDAFGASAVQGVNDAGRRGYYGPCPPPGKAHRYNFSIYAVDRLLEAGNRANRREVDNAMRGHILGQGRITTLYRR